MATTAEFARLSNAAYATGAVPPGWTVEASRSIPATGFHATAFKNQATGEIVVSYRGTDSARDALSYPAIAGWGSSGQFDQAVSFFSEVKLANPNATFSLTGHSLGGALAQFVAANGSGFVEAVTFGAPGVADSTLGVDRTTISAAITNYVFGSDPVTGPR